MKVEIAKLRQGIMEYPRVDAEVRGSRTENNPAAVQEQVYAELGKQLGVDPKLLSEKLPQLANQLKQSPNAGAYERANASYVAKDYAEAERLALEAAAESQRTKPDNSKNIVAALELAGLSAHRAIQYDRAMQHFREAEKLTVSRLIDHDFLMVLVNSGDSHPSGDHYVGPATWVAHLVDALAWGKLFQLNVSS